jgi:hypothetical protein
MQGPVATGVATGGGDSAFSRRLIHGISERPLGVDELLGQTFGRMRAMLGLPVEHVAAQLRTSPELVMLLESGDLRGLPSWQETWRVVTAYAHWLQIDPAPILERMHHQISSTRVDIGSLDHGGARALPVTGSAAHGVIAGHGASPKADVRRRPRRRRRSVVLALTAPVVLGMLATYAAHVRPAPLMTAISALPGPIANPTRSLLDLVLLHTSQRHGGFVWINVSDPRSRKADRLQTVSR